VLEMGQPRGPRIGPGEGLILIEFYTVPLWNDPVSEGIGRGGQMECLYGPHFWVITHDN
jgi:hypothetical protein